MIQILFFIVRFIFCLGITPLFLLITGIAWLFGEHQAVIGGWNKVLHFVWPDMWWWDDDTYKMGQSDDESDRD